MMSFPITQIKKTTDVLEECVDTRQRLCLTFPCDACGLEDAKILAACRLLAQYIQQIEATIAGEDEER